MGACTSAKEEKNSFSLQNPPEDTQLYNPASNHSIKTLNFEGTLSNVHIEGNIEVIRVSNLAQLWRNLRDIQWIHESLVPSQWNVSNQKFTLRLSEYQIRKNYLELTIQNQKAEIVDKKKINLFYILTGPIRNIFKIKGSDVAENLKILFDLKIVEIIKPEISIQKTQIFLKNQYPGEKFNFTFQLQLTDNGYNYRKMTTRPSKVCQVPLTKQFVLEEVEIQASQSPTRIKKNIETQLMLSMSAKLAKYTLLKWQPQTYLPSMKVNISTEQINGSMFVFHCWNVIDAKDSQKQVMKRFATFRFTVYHLFNGLSQLVASEDGVQFVKIQQDLWSNGQIVGQCVCQVKITIPKYLRQLQGWTMTDQGKINMLIQQIKQISETNDTSLVYIKCFQSLSLLHQKLISVKQQLVDPDVDFFIQQRLCQEAENLIQDINTELKGSIVQSHFFNKTVSDAKNLNQLRERQIFLLQMASTIIGILRDQGHFQLVEECWNFLNCLTRRGQFKLINVGFTPNEKRQLLEIYDKDSCHNKSYCEHKGKQVLHASLKQRVRIALEYQTVLFQCLILSLNTVPHTGQQGITRRYFCQGFKAECFFRIPAFRQCILNTITVQDESFEQITFIINSKQWINFQSVDIKSKQKEMDLEMDWEFYFYKALSFHPDCIEKIQELKRVIARSVWIIEISNRKSVFFQFLRILIQKMQKIQKRLMLPKCTYFSGYNKLISSFLHQMKTLPLKRYSNSLVKASMIMLNNQQLSQIIVSTISEKTNSYDPNAVIKCLSIFKLYVQFLTQNDKLLPLYFCQGTFIKVLKIILNGQASYCVAAVLLLFYESYDSFQIEFQRYLTSYFLGKIFIQLFYHWSYIVRYIFHNFFILKISQSKEIFGDKKCALYQKYSNVINKLRQNCILQQQLSSQKKTLVEIDRVFHLKMKQKLLRKKQANHSKHSQILAPTDKDNYLGLPLGISHNKTSPSKFISIQHTTDHHQIEVFDAEKKKQILERNPRHSDSIKIDFFKRQSADIIDSEQLSSTPSIQMNRKFTYHQSAKYNGSFLQNQCTLYLYGLSQILRRAERDLATADVSFTQIVFNCKQESRIRVSLETHFALNQNRYAVYSFKIYVDNGIALDEHDLKPEDIDFSNF